MADSTGKSKMGSGLKFFLWFIASILVLMLLYWLFFLRSLDRKKIKLLVAQAAAKYSDPASVEKLLLKGVEEIEASPRAFQQAKIYSKSSNIPIEQVLVDNSVAMAKKMGYIE